MSLALIEESSKEVRRLAVAGSALAVGDFRLRRLIQPLEQAGAKVPVFAQVAKSIGELVNGTEAESATRLLGLSTLLNAILYTQGQSGAAGEFCELESVPPNCATTKATARALKPVILALTTTGAGRLEIVRAAAERGLFKDPRLIDPAIHALEDSFPELAELVAKRILPEYGPGILPRLKANLDLKGKGSDARKLGAIHRLDPEGSLELCKTALAEGSPELRVAALACLGEHESCLPLVLEHVNSKNKAIHSAALEALAEHDHPEVSALFEQLIHGKTLDFLAGPFRMLRSRQVLGSMLTEGKRVFQSILGGDPDQVPRFGEILDCLEQRKDSEVEAFLMACLE